MFVPYETKHNSGRGADSEAKHESAERCDKAHNVLLLRDIVLKAEGSSNDIRTDLPACLFPADLSVNEQKWGGEPSSLSERICETRPEVGMLQVASHSWALNHAAPGDGRS
jgi:hypothetical protein